jgi:phospholipase A1/A2
LKSTVFILLFLLLSSRSFAHEVPEDATSSSPPQSRESSNKHEFFSAYKPNYIIGSTDGGKNSSCDLKFQISLKQRLAASKESESIEEIDKDWSNRFFFGYTQRAFWDICRESAPFRDSVFSPELFHVTEIQVNESDTATNHRLRTQLGLKHASNGRDGNGSRSWNRAYVEAVYSYGHDLRGSWFGEDSPNGFEEGSTPMLALGITAWYVIDSGDENHDIEDYLGYGRAMVSYSTKGEQINLSSWAGKQGKVSVEANLIIKALPFLNGIPLVGWVLPSTSNTYFWQLQYFDGYGDELLEYDKRQRIARLGLLFTY